MKKIVHYIPGSFLEITENWIYEQIKNLKGWHPIVYSNSIKNQEIFPIDNINIFSKSFTNNKGFINFSHKLLFKFFKIHLAILKQAKIDKPNLIHAHYGYAGVEIMHTKKKLGIPLITTFYGHDINRFPRENKSWYYWYRSLFSVGDVFLVEGSRMKKSLIKLGCKKEKIIINHLGIDTKTIQYKPRIKKTDDAIRILISARFVKKKGIPNALTALGEIKRKTPSLKLKITILGDCSKTKESQKEKEKILKTIKKYNIADIVHLKGMQSHSVFIEELYKNHIFLQASIEGENGDSEGGAPVSIIEATCSGMPVVGSNHCDIGEVIINNKNGYLVKENNVSDLEQKLYALITNSNKWKTFGENGRKHIINNYDSIKQGDKLSKIYNSLL